MTRQSPALTYYFFTSVSFIHLVVFSTCFCFCLLIDRGDHCATPACSSCRPVIRAHHNRSWTAMTMLTYRITQKSSQIHLGVFQFVEGVQPAPRQGVSLLPNAPHSCNPRLRFRGHMNQQMTAYMTLCRQNRYPPPKCSRRNSAYSPSIPSPFWGMSSTLISAIHRAYTVFSKHSAC